LLLDSVGNAEYVLKWPPKIFGSTVVETRYAVNLVPLKKPALTVTGHFESPKLPLKTGSVPSALLFKNTDAPLGVELQAEVP
jgi:hypothetical protein